MVAAPFCVFAVLWSNQPILRRASGVALAVYFAPLLDGRLEPPGTYHQYMWLRSWR